MKQNTPIDSTARLVLRAASMLLTASLLAAQASEPSVPNERPGRLSPIPSLVAGATTHRFDLNGTWRFNPAPPADFSQARAADDKGWVDIRVPGEWVMQGFNVPAGGMAGYMRVIDIPADWAGKCIKWRCEAVYCDATVWVNGREIGRHIGGFTPFEFDVTQAIRPGAANVLAMGVRADGVADLLSHGSKYASHCLGGVLRRMELFALPAANIASFHVSTTFDAAYQDATASLELDVANQGSTDIDAATIAVQLWAPDGTQVALGTSRFALPAIKAGQVQRAVCEVQVPAVRKWDCEHPNLYFIECALHLGGQFAQTVQRRIGFRQVEVRGHQLFVNNRPVRLRGICRHEVDPLGGRAIVDPTLWRRDAELYRAANINYIRTSHYPPAEEFIDACDELGLFVGEEAPFCFVGMTWGNDVWKTEDPNSPKYQVDIVRQTLEMVRRDRSHPSVIIWSLANESFWGNSFAASADAVASLDPTRPRVFSLLPWEALWNKPPLERYCTIGTDHYPGQEGPSKYADHHRPVLFDEYCHINAYEKAELNADPGVREEWLAPFERMWSKMAASPAILGGAIWTGISDAFHMPDGKITGCGSWGPIDEWRRTKPEYWHIRKVYSPLGIESETFDASQPGQPLLIDVENRYDFTNLSELRIEWKAGPSSGTVHADIAPRSRGTISIPAPVGDSVLLTFADQRGLPVDEFLLSGRKAWHVAATQPVQPIGGAPPKLTESPDEYTIASEAMTIRVDRRSGQIRRVEVSGEPVLVGGPVLTMLPLAGTPGADEYVENGFLNRMCSDWKAQEVTSYTAGDARCVQVFGAYKQAKGGYTLRMKANGDLAVYYFFKSEIAMSPRQLGMVFELPAAFDTLSWKRRARWNAYPLDHIGRPEGSARASRDASWPKIGDRTAPPWPWSLDSNELGTVDFRSTRTAIEWASLSSASTSLTVQGDGQQSVRCWLAGDRLRILVAEYSRASGEPYLNKWGRHFKDDRRIIEKESVIEDTIRLQLRPAASRR